MRVYAPVIAAIIVAGCAPQVPNSASGVGFGSTQSLQQQRAAELAGTGTIELGATISDEVVPGGATEPTVPTIPTVANTVADPVAELAAATLAELGADGVSEPTAEPVTEVATAPVKLNRDNPTISDEQDFAAVSARETIESDIARRAAQQEAYQVIAPTALPTRQGGPGAVVVEFALSTTNLVGQSLYQRSGLNSASRFQRNCAKYASSNLAQQAFLQAGGPQRDRRAVDPDGDGFACFWDPTPFRQAVRN